QSQVVLARNEDKNVITMVNDYEGDFKEFAMVVPVPTVIQKEQVHVTENKIVEHLDAYSSPRLVEYFDANPCQVYAMERLMAKSTVQFSPASDGGKSLAGSYGIKIEAEYSVGEYDILVLSAKESLGLIKWLNENNYKIPQGAEQTLNRLLIEKTGNKYLRPLQVAYESEKFMLPIRLGTVNADGPQELFIFMLTKNGRVEPANYRMVKIASDINIPLYVKNNFNEFYKAMFDTAVKKESMKAIFLEYAWDMGSYASS
ncbi:hypothetical protein RFI_39650, partial [Reticulomyxa filosa]